MFSSLSALVSLLCLLNVCTARVPAYPAATLLHSNRSLFGRAETTAPKTSDLFSIGTASTAGGCSSQIATTDAWLAEAVLLHNAAMTAYGNYRTDAGTRLLFTALMGVRFDDDDDVIYIDDVSDILWDAIGGRLDAVTKFLGGGGLIDPVTSEPPWIFDRYGNPVPSEADESGTPTGYVTLAAAFPNLSVSSMKGYFIAQVMGYLFSSATLLCDPNTGTYAATNRQAIASSHADVTVATYDRFVYFCPRSFDPLGQTPKSELHSVPLLSTSVSSTGYPTSATSKPLDQYVPLSGTFYHELFHLTDSAQTTRDPFYGLDVATQAALEADQRISTNPESFVLFAMAAYMYQNPPEGIPSVLFLNAGLPQIASVAIKEAAAGN